MWVKVVQDGLSNDFEGKSRWIGSSFILLGLLTILYILFSPQTPTTVLGVSLTIVGLFSTYLTAKLNMHQRSSWSKSLLLFFTGAAFLFIGLSTISSIDLLVGLFFLFSTINNLYLAYKTRKDSTAVAWIIHALVSGIFATVLLTDPTLSIYTIGLFIAINLISDGLVVLYSGRTIFIRP